MSAEDGDGHSSNHSNSSKDGPSDVITTIHPKMNTDKELSQALDRAEEEYLKQLTSVIRKSEEVLTDNLKFQHRLEEIENLAQTAFESAGDDRASVSSGVADQESSHDSSVVDAEGDDVQLQATESDDESF